jgi:hypothetical protein
MKYVISENQYKLLLEYDIPLSVKRRANRETLQKYILVAEEENPPECLNYEDGYDYADIVIDHAVDLLIEQIGPDIDQSDEYSDILDYLRNMCRDIFGESLIYLFEDNCSDSEDDEEYDEDDVLSESITVPLIRSVLRRLSDESVIPLMKEIIVEGFDIYDPCSMSFDEFEYKILESSAMTLVYHYHDYDSNAHVNVGSVEGKILIKYIMEKMEELFHNKILDFYNETEC